jgi:hypothetical protein
MYVCMYVYICICICIYNAGVNTFKGLHEFFEATLKDVSLSIQSTVR